MNSSKFIGTIGMEDVRKTITVDPWKPFALDYPPYPVVKPSNGYMFTLGSGNISLATISPERIQYNSGIDVFRYEFNPRLNEPFINVDHYIAGSLSESVFAVYKTPPQDYHWLRPTHEIIKYAPIEWQYCLKDVLTKGKYNVD